MPVRHSFHTLTRVVGKAKLATADDSDAQRHAAAAAAAFSHSSQPREHRWQGSDRHSSGNFLVCHLTMRFAGYYRSRHGNENAFVVGMAFHASLRSQRRFGVGEFVHASAVAKVADELGGFSEFA